MSFHAVFRLRLFFTRDKDERYKRYRMAQARLRRASAAERFRVAFAAAHALPRRRNTITSGRAALLDEMRRWRFTQACHMLRLRATRRRRREVIRCCRAALTPHVDDVEISPLAPLQRRRLDAAAMWRHRDAAFFRCCFFGL